MGWWKKLKDGVKKTWNGIKRNPIKPILTAIGGAIGGGLGFVIGGPVGAVVGILIGIEITWKRLKLSKKTPRPIKMPRRMPKPSKERPAPEEGKEEIKTKRAPKKETSYAYVGNKDKDNMEVHKASCSWADNIKAENRVYFKSLEEAHTKGFDNCHWCLGGSKR